jgi:ribosomal-protein-alanine N-acetyltransferase
LTYSTRPMEKDDLDQVTDIDREAFPTQWPPANYSQELNNRLAHYIVTCHDGRTYVPPEGSEHKSLVSWLKPLLGRGGAAESDSAPVPRQYIVGFSGIWVLAEEAHITNIAVRQEYRRRGIGELLMLATIDLAVELHAVVMTLEVRASNRIAQSLYNKFGFKQVGVRYGYYLDNREDAVIMTTESIASDSFRARVRRLRAALEVRLDDERAR